MHPRPPIPFIPPKALRLVENLTPYPHFHALKMGPGRAYFDTLVLKATYDLTPRGLVRSESQAPIDIADLPRPSHAPERSSLAVAGEVLLAKPSTDVIVTGTARTSAPQARWTTAVVVSDAAGRTLANASADVCGPRAWQHRALRGWVLGDPSPTAAVPIEYERAYGGAYRDRATGRWRTHGPNPSGTGFFDVEALDVDREYPAPQWESPDAPVVAMSRDVPVAGYGPIARHWDARSRFAGTYDDAWETETREAVMAGFPPDYAADFDLRFFQCAHPSLICPRHLRGDEQIGLGGLLERHPRFTVRLPGVRIEASVRRYGYDWTDRYPPLDTVRVDLDAMKVYLCWRLTLNLHEEALAAVLSVEEVA